MQFSHLLFVERFKPITFLNVYCVYFQVEVYQSDFNAEREARERIAGEKADLAEQLSKFKKPTGNKIIFHTTILGRS